MNKFTASIAIIAASAAFLAPANAARPQEVDGRLTTQVIVADLNLSSIAGQTALNSRIRGAASAVCSPFKAYSRLPVTTSYRDCVKLAVQNATAVSQPRIAAALSRQTKIAAR